MTEDVQKGGQGASFQVNPMRFRPNLVISGGEPYAEDGWRNLRIGHKYFSVSYCIFLLEDSYFKVGNFSETELVVVFYDFFALE